MSYLTRWVRHNQSLAARSTSFLTLSQTGSILEASSISNIKPLYQVSMQTQPLTTTPTVMAQMNHKPKGEQHNQAKPTKGDDIKYVIRFKDLNGKQVFKQFYSLYGPLFIVCHIGLSLTSLGFFCSLTYFAIDLTDFLPNIVYSYIGERMAEVTGAGGKFVVAYAIHKVLLPLRLAGAIWLTRFLSKYVKKRKSS